MIETQRAQVLTALAATLMLAACSGKTESSTEYAETIHAWRQHRDAGLRSPDGWLTLSGLFWLKQGDNHIGSAPSNDFIVPEGSAPGVIGNLHLTGDRVEFLNEAGSAVRLNGKPIQASAILSYDENHPDLVQAGVTSFYVIKRVDKLGVRAKNSASPLLKSFEGMKYFPLNTELRFQDAKLIPDPRKIPILNVLGQTEMEDSPGYVEFSYRGEQYRIRPIYEGNTLFFLFKDSTNKIQTYQAGRMLNTPLPVNGKVDLDFNRSYNPPCTFTPYATCPLPPKENTLSFAVEAGELRYSEAHT